MAAFTSIAAGIGIAASAGGAAMSFSQAEKQRAMSLKAKEEVDKMTKLAEKTYRVNPLDAISIPLDAFQLESEAMLQQGAQLTEAGKESERGVAATAGRVQAAQNTGQAKIRSDAAETITSLDIASAKEDANIRDKVAGLYTDIAAGAATAAADSAKAANQYQQQGVQQVISTVGQIAQAAPLYAKSSASRQFDKFDAKYNEMAASGNLPAEFMGADGKPLSSSQAFAKASGLTGDQLAKVGTQVTKQDTMGKQYTAYDINPFQIKGMEGLNAKQIKQMRKGLDDPTAFGGLSLYEPGIIYR